jgi:hypothetical protein
MATLWTIGGDLQLRSPEKNPNSFDNAAHPILNF